MENRGKLLVSTQCNPTKKLILFIITVVAAILLIVLTLDNDGFVAAIVDKLDNEVWEWIIGGIVGFIVATGLIDVIKGFKSYCVVYENAVVGTTKFSLFNSSESLKEFTLNYNEITNISENKTILHIYTSYTTFKVNALDNCAAAAQEIRKRIGNGAAATPASGVMNSGHTSNAQTSNMNYNTPKVNNTPNAQNNQPSYIGLNTQNNRIKKQ